MNAVLKAAVTFLLAVSLPVAALAAPAEWPKKLTVGLIPTESSSHITDRFDNLHRYLEKKLGPEQYQEYKKRPQE